MGITREANPEEYSAVGEDRFEELKKQTDKKSSDNITQIITIIKSILLICVVGIVIYALYLYVENVPESNVALFIEDVFGKLREYSDVFGIVLFAVLLFWIFRLLGLGRRWF